MCPDQFESDYRRLFTDRSAFLVGDLNAKSALFGSEGTCARGRMLEELAGEALFTCLNTGEGSHITATGKLTPLNVSFVSANLSHNCGWGGPP